MKAPTTLKQVEKALKASGGFISHAAKMLGITQSAVTQRIQRHESLQIALNEIKDSHLDLAESKLINKIEKEDLGAICFYLKCQGKGRGYIEKQQADDFSDKATPVTVIIQKDDIESKSE